MILDKDHYLNLKNGIFDSTSKADLDHLITTFATAPQRDRLVVHFHGGLVSAQRGMDRAERLMEYYKDLNAYQVFFVWESGLLEVLSNNLREIYKERIFQQLLMRITQFVTAKIKQQEGERGGRLELPDELEVIDELHQPTNGHEPFGALSPTQLPPEEKLQEIEKDQFRETLKNDYILTDESQAIANSLSSPGDAGEATRGVGATASTHTLMSPSILDDIRSETPDPETRGLVTVGFIIESAISVLTRVIDRYAKRRDHGLYATAVEELLRQFYLANAGKAVWDLIRNETIDAFGDDPNQYGGTAFLEGLKTYCESGQRPHITLVGHSAGAIYTCYFLKHADSRLQNDVTFDVVLLAPACNFKLFFETLTKYGHRIAALRVFGMLDTVEQADLLVPLVYPHSLLYLVSGIFEDDPDTPLVGMQRYFSPKAPYDMPEVTSSLEYLLTSPVKRAVWSVAQGGDGLSSSATKHGGFYDDVPTLESLGYIISRGF